MKFNVVSLLLILVWVLISESGLACQESENTLTGGQVNGIVKNPDGEVVSSATVFLYRANQSGSYSLSRDPEPLSAMTDSQGRFAFDDLEPGKYCVWAEGEGLNSAQSVLNGKEVVVSETENLDEQVELQLAVACNYQITVVDAESKEPIPETEITLAYADAPRKFQTDENGVATLSGLPACDWYFVAKAKGFAVAHLSTSKQEVGTTTKLRFELQKGSGVFGELIDQFGKPVSKATIYVSNESQAMAVPYGKTETDDEGMYSLDGLPVDEKLRIQISKPDHEFATFHVVLEEVGKLEKIYLEGERLPYGGDASITVVNARGEPIEGIELINRGNGTGKTRQATTNSEGLANLENMLHYEGCHVVARGKGMIPKSVSVKPGPKGEPTQLKIELVEGKSISGRVVGPDDEPIERAMILIYAGVDFVTLEDLKWERIYSDAEGRFKVHGLKEPTKLRIMPHYQSQYTEVKGFEVDFAKAEQQIELPLGAGLRVRAVDTDGEPIQEFNVKLKLVDFENRRPDDPAHGVDVRLSDPGVNIQGTAKEFQLGGQQVGQVYKVIVSADGYETKTVARIEATVRPELTDIQLKKK